MYRCMCFYTLYSYIFAFSSKWQPNYCGNTTLSNAKLQFMCAEFFVCYRLKWLMIYEAGRNRVTNEIETKMATNGRISFPIYYFRRFSYKHNPLNVYIFPHLFAWSFPSVRLVIEEAFCVRYPLTLSLPRISFLPKKWFMVERCGQSSLVLLCMKCFCH